MFTLLSFTPWTGPSELDEGSGNSPSNTPFRYQAFQVSPKKARKTIFPPHRTYIWQQQQQKSVKHRKPQIKSESNEPNNDHAWIKKKEA